MPKRTLPAAGGGLPPHSSRAAVEATIARLIDLLDHLDGDTDLEPSISWTASYADTASVTPAGWAAPPDAELDECDLEDDEIEDDREDREASLGASNDEEDQTHWSGSDPRLPVDVEHDDGEHDNDNSDREPSLGAPEGNLDQTAWAQGNPEDLELTGTLDDLQTWAPAFRSIAETIARRDLEAAVFALAARIRLGRCEGRRPRRAPRPSRGLPIPTRTCE